MLLLFGTPTSLLIFLYQDHIMHNTLLYSTNLPIRCFYKHQFYDGEDNWVKDNELLFPLSLPWREMIGTTMNETLFSSYQITNNNEITNNNVNSDKHFFKHFSTSQRLACVTKCLYFKQMIWTNFIWNNSVCTINSTTLVTKIFVVVVIVVTMQTFHCPWVF